MNSLLDLDCVSEALRDGMQLLTPNQRLADALHAAAAARERDDGKGALRVPRVQALQPWCLALWRELRWRGGETALSLRLLSEGEELTLWLAAIAADTDATGTALLHPERAAQSARDAYDLLLQWQLQPEHAAEAVAFAASADSVAFLRWRQRFVAHCRQRGWQSRAALPQLLLEAFVDGSLPRREPIALFGFIELSPLRRQLLEAAAPLRELRAPPRPRHSPPQLVVCEDAREELRCAARWAHAALADDPAHSVAIVVPNLAQRRAELRTTLLEVLDPGALLESADGAELPFNLSLGTVLSREALITPALALLRLVTTGLAPTELRSLLQSATLSLGIDDGECTLLAERLTRWLGEMIAPHQLRGLSDERAGLGLCRHLAEMQRKAPQRRAPISAWVRAWRDQLDACRWPMGTLDSREYQLLRRWGELLDELAAGDEVHAEMSGTEALSLLHRSSRRCLFQPRSGTARLQVLGALEADQLRFSHLWLCSMDDAHWPLQQQPNPLLPRSLQANLGMPRADRHRELDYARCLSDSFLNAADKLVISYAEGAQDAESARPSVLFGTWAAMPTPQATAPDKELIGWCTSQSKAATYAQEYATPQAAPLAEAEGSFAWRALSDQSDCPFRALARHRLRAEHGAMPDAAAAAQRQFNAVRGQLLHSALEQLWGVLGDRDGLQQCEQHSLEALIASSVATAVLGIQNDQRRWGSPERQRFWHLETQRNRALLMRWLQEIELIREEDFQVTLREVRRELRLSGVPFSLRVDRVDTLTKQGIPSLFIIDYKSGANEGTLQRHWGGKRPSNPQLPLYALALEEEGIPVRGLAYAELRAAQLRWRGAVECWANPPIPQAPEQLSWTQQLQRWRDSLGDLAAQFAAGEAAVTPRDQNSCRNCACAALCRIAESGA